MSIKQKLALLNAAKPILKQALYSGQLFNPQCELIAPHQDILCEYDVDIPVSQGTLLKANIYRSKSAANLNQPVPVVMCAHPYDNRKTPALKNTPFAGAPQQYRLIPQAGRPRFSTLTSWESPDPNFWIPNGYAVVNLNLPGYANSTGHPSVFTEHQAQCYYEAIEWIAKQSWCTGNIGLNGVSFLAITQYHVATCQVYGGPPPALKCISPWEGLTDMYRDAFCSGGVTETGFPDFWWYSEVLDTINGTEQDFLQSEGSIPPDYLAKHPMFDDFWAEKSAKVEQITLPMLVCGSFSDHGLHTMGSLRAFEQAKSQHKWLYTHRDGKWDVYYSPEVQELTKRFMDCFVKGDTDNGFLETPAVRLEVRSARDKIHQVRYEQQWPPASTRYKRLYFDHVGMKMRPEPLNDQGELVYSPQASEIVLEYGFESDTEVTGYMKLQLWISIADTPAQQEQDDISLFARFDKLDKSGQPITFFGTVGAKNDMLSRACINVSHRAIDQGNSTDWKPVLSHQQQDKIAPGQIVKIEMPAYPHATFFEKGERLRLTLSSKDIISNPPFRKIAHGSNHWIVHCGNQYDSFLQIPILSERVESAGY